MSASSSLAPAGASPFGVPVTEKLGKNNYLLWKAQVLPAVRGAQMFGYLDGTVVIPPQEVNVKDGDKIAKGPNPEYAQWVAADQQVLGYMMSSLSRDVLAQVVTVSTAAQLWKALEEMFSSRIRARAINTRIALSTTKKGNMTVNEYITKMKALGDEVAAAGKPLDDEDMVSYILAGLDADFEPVVSALTARVEPVTVAELYSQLLGFEVRADLRQGVYQTSANSALFGRGGNQRGRGRSRGNFGTNSGRGRGGGRDASGAQGGNRPVCQLCGKIGHTVSICWHRYDPDFAPQEKMASAATPQSYGIDTNWYIDTGATDHVTGELDKLSVKEKYNGRDQIHTANGTGYEESPSSRQT